MGEVSRGSHFAEAGTDVVDAGHYGGKGRGEIHAVDGDAQHGSEEQKHIDSKIGGDSIRYRRGNRRIVAPDYPHFPGIDLVTYLTEGRFDQNDHTGHLQTAAGRACTGAHEHQDDQNYLREGWPQLKICRSVAGCGNNGGDLEESVSQRLEGGLIPRQNINSDTDHRCGNDAQIPSQFFAFEDLDQLTGKKEIINIEVDTKQQHKDTDYPIDIGTVVVPDAGIFDAESAGTRRTECMNKAVEKRHSTAQKENDQHHRHNGVNQVQNPHVAAKLCYQLAKCWTGGFCFQDMYSAVSLIPAIRISRKESNGQSKHSHTAYPVSPAPPEQKAGRKCLHVGQDAGACGGESGHRFKKGIYECGNLPAQIKRERTEQ